MQHLDQLAYLCVALKTISHGARADVEVTAQLSVLVPRSPWRCKPPCGFDQEVMATLAADPGSYTPTVVWIFNLPRSDIVRTVLTRQSPIPGAGS